MSLLDGAVDAVGKWDDERNDDRVRCVKLLEQATDHMRRAIAIWRASLDKAPQSGNRFTAVLWMGAEPARQLQAIHLASKETAAALTELTGVPFKNSLDLAEELDVVQPYEQLGPGESGSDRAESAIAVMNARTERIEDAIRDLSR